VSRQVTILGGGAWGTALAQMAARCGHCVHLYARDGELVDEINNHHSNRRYLGDEIILDSNIRATLEGSEALTQADFILAAIPAQSLRQVLVNLRNFLPPQAVLILCAKGIERSSRLFMSKVVKQILPQQKVAVLSGPSFATDVARGLPTAVTIAAENSDLAQELAQTFSHSSFRCYASDDVTGVEVGGACKNVLALAAGVAMGRDLGLSAQAALVTRGFAELRRIGARLGAKPETMGGLSVLGDLMLTCSSPQSRNYAYGLALGQGLPVEGLALAEGVATAPVAADLCDELGINAPIIHTVASLINGNMAIEEAVHTLINRPLKFED